MPPLAFCAPIHPKVCRDFVRKEVEKGVGHCLWRFADNALSNEAQDHLREKAASLIGDGRDPKFYPGGITKIPGESSEKVVTCFIGGINTTRQENIERATFLSEQLGGKEVILFHNPTEGVVSDLHRAAAERRGVMLSQTRGYCSYAKEKVDEGMTVVLIGHSEGGMDTKQIGSRM